jgi:hypothetical protein
MTDAKSLFQSEKYLQCLAKCEAEIPILTSVDKKFPLHVLASRAALLGGELDKAVAHGEVAVRLDPTKMVSFQTLNDALVGSITPQLSSR